MRVDPKVRDRVADYLDTLVGAFVLGSVAAAFITPIVFLWFVARWWIQ